VGEVLGVRGRVIYGSGWNWGEVPDLFPPLIWDIRVHWKYGARFSYHNDVLSHDVGIPITRELVLDYGTRSLHSGCHFVPDDVTDEFPLAFVGG